MILCNITDRKDFMGKLLGSDCFDAFLLGEAVIHTASSYVIDGRINRDFFTKEELEDPQIVPYEYAEWKNIRPFCFDLMKGKRTPTSFQFVLYLKPENMQKVLSRLDSDEDTSFIRYMVMNIKFDVSSLCVTSGISYRTFSVDKQPESLWDHTLKQFLDNKQISYDLPL
ncbi:MAG: DUF5721 family protein [Lachnospiraceae bacterium]